MYIILEMVICVLTFPRLSIEGVFFIHKRFLNEEKCVKFHKSFFLSQINLNFY